MSTMLLSMYEIDGRIKIDNFKSNLSIFITPWSISHFIFGYMAQAFGINYLYGLTAHTIYEYSNYVSYTLKKNGVKTGKDLNRILYLIALEIHFVS